ncbi:hypothetical protein [Parasutterella excrementihominis]|uniref:hypothetical protein n=1 Tax=Parasutterella excrementihominis TaxID=487175 RepID=UPI003A8D2522
MQGLKFKFSKARFKVSGSNRLMMPWRFLSYGLLSLLIGMSLAGCATNCPNLKEEQPKILPLESVLNFSDWQSRRKNSSEKLKSALNSATSTTAKKDNSKATR